ncbi:MAG: ABC transporter permease [Acetobacteraceae bacterium]
MNRVLSRVFYWVIVGILFAPLALMVAMSFKDAPFVGFPIGGVTFGWYVAAIADPDAVRAFFYSLGIAAASAMLAVAAGVWIALAIDDIARPGLRFALFCGAAIPLVTPGIVSAIAMRMFVRLVGIDPGPVAVALGHAAHAAPFAVIMVGIRLRTMPRTLLEAARDLGAGALRGFLCVTLPWLRPAIAGAGLLAMLESFDDFLRSFFLSGVRPTLPVLIYARLHSGLSPEINAIAALVLILTLAFGFSAERQLRRAGAR